MNKGDQLGNFVHKMINWSPWWNQGPSSFWTSFGVVEPWLDWFHSLPLVDSFIQDYSTVNYLASSNWAIGFEFKLISSVDRFHCCRLLSKILSFYSFQMELIDLELVVENHNLWFWILNGILNGTFWLRSFGILNR